MIRQWNAPARSWFEKIKPDALNRQIDGLPTVWRANAGGIPFFAFAARVAAESWIAGRRSSRRLLVNRGERQRPHDGVAVAVRMYAIR
jgi:hypothetical protein